MKSESGWLFPNQVLKNKIKTSSYTATIVGDVFEVITQVILGGDRIHADGSADGIYKNRERLWECKATQTRHYFKLTGPQTDAHLKNKNMPTDWILWAYFYPHDEGDGGLTGRSETVLDLINYLNLNITVVHFIPAETMASLLKSPAVRYKEYDSWHDAEGNPYRVYQLPHYLLDEIRWNKSFPQRTTFRRIKYSYCGKDFETNLFTFVKHKRPKAKTKKRKGDIPF